MEGENGLHPLQKAFIEHFAIQCGYCTPGMILSAKALLDENPHATEDEIREVARVVRDEGFESVAVTSVFSPVADAHEKRAAAAQSTKRSSRPWKRRAMR